MEVRSVSKFQYRGVEATQRFLAVNGAGEVDPVRQVGRLVAVAGDLVGQPGVRLHSAQVGSYLRQVSLHYLEEGPALGDGPGLRGGGGGAAGAAAERSLGGGAGTHALHPYRALLETHPGLAGVAAGAGDAARFTAARRTPLAPGRRLCRPGAHRVGHALPRLADRAGAAGRSF